MILRSTLLKERAYDTCGAEAAADQEVKIGLNGALHDKFRRLILKGFGDIFLTPFTQRYEISRVTGRLG